MYNIEICDSLEKLEKREEEWLELELKSNNININTNYYWIKSYLEIFLNREDEAFGYEKKPLILFLYKNGLLKAIAPFIVVVRKKYGVKFKFIEFIGQQWAGTLIDIIGYDLHKEDFNQIFNYLYSNYKFDLIHLKYIPEYTRTIDISSRNSAILSGCPFIELSEYQNFEDYYSKIYSKGTKQNIRTAHNNMKKMNYKYDSIKYQPSDKFLQEIINISKTKLNDSKHSIYLDKDKKLFVEKLLYHFENDVIFCELNNKKVAYRLNFYYRNNKYCFDASYDRNTPKKLRVGNLSVHESVKDSFSNQLGIYTEGIGLDEYKLAFMKRVLRVYSYTVKGNTITAFLLEKKFLKNQKKIEAEVLQHLDKFKISNFWGAK
jgi:hypothetical protein